MSKGLMAMAPGTQGEHLPVLAGEESVFSSSLSVDLTLTWPDATGASPGTSVAHSSFLI